MPTRPLHRLLAAVAIFVAVGVALALLLTQCGGNRADHVRPGTPPTTPSAPNETPRPAPPPASGGDVVVVKIDNVQAARPHTGLDAADVVYVEPVEGGLTRLVAVYSSDLPPLVGPVRSARESDIELLAQYGHPTFAYSGSAPEIVPLLQAAPMTLVTESNGDGAYVRDPARPVPHNLYVHPADLPRGTGPGPHDVLSVGDAPSSGGTPTTDEAVSYPAASYQLHWSPDSGRWLVTLDGTPLVSTGAGPVSAATVVVQSITVRQGGIEDATGARAPVAQTVGTGPATVLRDGMAYQGTWSRPGAGDGTRFTTAGGEPLPVTDGPVWIFLVPR